MGFWDTITDLVDAATPWSTVEAEAPSSNPAGAGPAKESAVRHQPCRPSGFTELFWLATCSNDLVRQAV
jgi:hypothetical protein